jgi:hypothetical protein
MRNDFKSKSVEIYILTFCPSLTLIFWYAYLFVVYCSFFIYKHFIRGSEDFSGTEVFRYHIKAEKTSVHGLVVM